jgi:hypothetical protein
MEAKVSCGKANKGIAKLVERKQMKREVKWNTQRKSAFPAVSRGRKPVLKPSYEAAVKHQFGLQMLPDYSDRNTKNSLIHLSPYSSSCFLLLELGSTNFV